MNKSNLKRYAPQARKDFIAAVTGRAHVLGLSAIGNSLQVEPCTVSGDAVLIGGRAWPVRVNGQREQLVERMKRDGFDQTLDAIAYTWFNRLAALRYMELHDYLGHGRRVLSNPAGGPPEVLAHALELAETGELPGLTADAVRQLKLDNKDGELYRRVLVAQCNALNRAMPFLFEAIDDETELLLPENLLLSDSIVAKLVAEVPEEDWAEVEVIGWLYQFYISEKKDQVIGKVVKSEDIPAATQLFTPNWIVQYLVQNSVGRLWLMANPTSTLASQWPYYIQPAEQTPEVQAQLDALIQARIAEDGDSLNPESITVLDPACGSGHILVEAYEVLKTIYLERGYRLRDVPRLILEKNLFGLDIDDRAAQMAAFALLMKARKDDRRLLSDPDNPPRLTVLSLQESKSLHLDELASHLAPYGVERGALEALLDAFEHAKTFGSLIRITPELSAQLPTIGRAVQRAQADGDLYAKHAAHDLEPLLGQALVLAMQFDAVVANPPYMSNKGMGGTLKEHIKTHFPSTKSDIFAAFIERAWCWCKNTAGASSMVTMQSWMFLSAFETMRTNILSERTIQTMAHFGARAFSEISGEVVQTTATSFFAKHIDGFKPTFFRLTDGIESQKIAALRSGSNKFQEIAQDDFSLIPGSPIAYWISHSARNSFLNGKPLHTIAVPRAGMITGNNAKFVRLWHEVSIDRLGLRYTNREDARLSGRKWFPYQKGGAFRKWYGNYDAVVDWENDGRRLRTTTDSNGKVPAHAFNEEFIFKPNVNWSAITSTYFSVRITDNGCLFDASGSAAFPDHKSILTIAGFLNSKVAQYFLHAINPTVNFQAWNIGNLPLDKNIINNTEEVDTIVRMAKNISKIDWDSHEGSWDFPGLPWVEINHQKNGKISDAYSKWEYKNREQINTLKELEERNNSIFIEAHKLQTELSPEVHEEQITLIRASRERDCQKLISYALGCTFGRYSLDVPGLIYAHAGNVGFNPGKYSTFPADADGILPITEARWFEEDAGSRVVEFICTVWGGNTLDENLNWLADSLGRKASETAEEAIRRYLADNAYKDHLQFYKKRPIYWLFSSGKQGAFQALVYLHRYHEGTLARMRAEYVLPLTGKMHARIDTLQADIRAANSTAARTRLTKQLETLKKQLKELLDYDEKLRHYADQRIALDLDDGVKVNYGKFGDLLAEVKAVTGGTSEE